MTNDPVPMFRIDVSADVGANQEAESKDQSESTTIIALLQELVAGQSKHNQLLEDMIQQVGAAQ